MRGQIPLDRFKALTEAATSLVGAGELENLLSRLVETACQTTGARYGALGVIGEHKTLTEFVHTGIDPRTVSLIGHFPRGRGVLGVLIRDETTIRLARISDHPDSVGFPDHHPEMETFLGVPVGTSQGAFGNLYLTEKEGGFTEEDEVVVGALAAIAGAAVETARLRAKLAAMAVVEDRERIGRDLHDSIIQDLFATGLELQGAAALLEDESVSRQLDRAVDRIDSTIEALRRIVTNLNRPEPASSFLAELRAHADHLAGPYEVTISVTVRPPDLEVDPDLTAEILPMLGEGLSNALRHSGTDTVDIVVEAVARRLVLSVTDQGSGFEVEHARQGMGLPNLAARAERLSGDVSIRSIPGAGTVVEVVLPLA